MSYPPPDPGYPPPPQPRKRRWPLILAIVLVALLLCCGGAGYGIYRFFANVSAPARDAANSFVEQLERGDIDAAYSSLCGPTKEAYSRAEFDDYLATQQKITGHSTTGFDVQSSGGQSTATVTMRLTYADGSTRQHVFELLKEGSTYRVCGDPY
jgi:hypothetical protein